MPITMNVQEKEIEKRGKPKISDTKEQKRTIIIDVKGAVSKEGVYEMKEGDRVKDAVQKAGGFFIRSRYEKSEFSTNCTRSNASLYTE